MNISSNLKLLSEAANNDININTNTRIKYESVLEEYNNIPEMDEISVTEAKDVIITETLFGKYYVEMVNLSPFMLDSGIKSISKALDLVAEANGLRHEDLGLVVESQDAINAKLENARIRAKKTGNKNILENMLIKIHKDNLLIKKLISEGHDVVKKSSDSKVCPKCGKAMDKCDCCDDEEECGDGSCDSKAVIAEKCKK